MMPQGSAADEHHLSQRASSQGGRASQSEARPASQASSSQVLQFHKNFLHFHHGLLAKPASDTMLVAATGCTDAFWRPSTRYLNIPVELRQLPPKTGRVKKEKMEKVLFRMKKFMSKWRKLLYIPGRIGAATSRQQVVAFRRDTRNVHYVACSAPKCDFIEENDRGK